MLGDLARVMRYLPLVLGIAGTVVAAVEALGTAITAAGEEKRAVAVEKLREQLAELGVPVSEKLLGPVVDVTVWLLNTFTARQWTEDAAEVADGMAEGMASAKVAREGGAELTVATREQKERSLEEIEASVRAEFDALTGARPAVAEVP